MQHLRALARKKKIGSELVLIIGAQIENGLRRDTTVGLLQSSRVDTAIVLSSKAMQSKESFAYMVSCVIPNGLIPGMSYAS